MSLCHSVTKEGLENTQVRAIQEDHDGYHMDKHQWWHFSI